MMQLISSVPGGCCLGGYTVLHGDPDRFGSDCVNLTRYFSRLSDS